MVIATNEKDEMIALNHDISPTLIMLVAAPFIDSNRNTRGEDSITAPPSP